MYYTYWQEIRTIWYYYNTLHTQVCRCMPRAIQLHVVIFYVAIVWYNLYHTQFGWLQSTIWMVRNAFVCRHHSIRYVCRILCRARYYFQHINYKDEGCMTDHQTTALCCNFLPMILCLFGSYTYIKLQLKARVQTLNTHFIYM